VSAHHSLLKIPDAAVGFYIHLLQSRTERACYNPAGLMIGRDLPF